MTVNCETFYTVVIICSQTEGERNFIKASNLFFLNKILLRYREIKSRLERDFGINVITPFCHQNKDEKGQKISQIKSGKKKNAYDEPLKCLDSGKARMLTYGQGNG